MTYFSSDTPTIVLKSIFAKYDKDGSGCLSQDELKDMARQDFGMTKAQAEAFILLTDKDGNQKISFEEFIEWIRSGDRFSAIDDKSKFYRLQKAITLFKELDKDGSGVLEKSEVNSLLLSQGGKPEHFDSHLKALDKSGDGTVSFPEFLDYLNWIPRD
ncbi:calmodulin-like protein 11 [Asterias rubens]|uniref:calmodulin-like protein 11 n=1 Tax=Asterias rubens TaxID=7604 RepID=UPI0014553CE9|nr:calmodulin-like protein 11 [Asterias rubens]